MGFLSKQTVTIPVSGHPFGWPFPLGRQFSYLDGKPTKRHVVGKYERKLSKMSRAVVIDGVRYESTAAAARHFNTSVAAIKYAIRNSGRYKGLRCEYATK